MDKIYVVDALNVLFRSYYAISGMTNPKGESTNALYGFIRSIFKIMKDFSPEYMVVVFDAFGGKDKRKEVYSGYKSHRKAMPEDLIPQVEQATAFCEMAGIPHLTVNGYEADDTMGSIARWAEKKGIKTYLCSSDKDLCQLVDDKTFMINLHKDNLLIDRKKVKEIYGVTPEQMIDYLAIVGDASDNIPGLEGFGPKTAATLLQEFKTLDTILAHPEKIPGKKKQETAAQDKEVALMSRELATIITSVPFPKKESFFHIQEPDIPTLSDFYHEMHFMSLLRDLGKEEKPTAKHHKKGSYELIDDEKSLAKLVTKLKKAKEICIDTETTGVNPHEAELVGIGLTMHPKEAYYLPCNGSLGKEAVLKALKPLFATPFIGHNIKYDYHILKRNGLEIKKIAYDTIIASYILRPQNARHNLDELSLEIFGKIKIPISNLIGKGKKQKSMLDVPIETVSDYCCEDVDYTYRLKEHFAAEMKKQKVDPVFEDVELPLIPVLAKMEERGIYCDTKKLNVLSKQFGEQIKELETKIYRHGKGKFNINSPKQLGDVLFKKLKIPPPKKTPTGGYSTSADVLEKLKNEYPIVEEILHYRTFEKLRSTYVDTLPNQINPRTGRIHSTFTQFSTATGRLASQDPNLQNIPIRSSEGKKIRSAFKPQESNWSFLSADYSQIELRLLAHFSGDPALIKAFKDGEDIHAYTASLVYDIPIKKITADMRHKAKTVNFGILYGQQAYGLSAQLGIPYREASDFIKTYFERYTHVKEYLDKCKEAVRKKGYAETITGRRRPIPEIHSKNHMVRSAAERLAVNTPLQGTQADLVKMAMIKVDRFLSKESFAHMLLQIHDELIFESPDTKIKKLGREVQKIMETIIKLKVPLSVDISFGKNWGEC